MVTEDEYTYTGKDGSCQNMSNMKTKISDATTFTDVTANDPVALATAVSQGPVSVGVDADGDYFQFWEDGVLTKHCGHKIDHGVLVIGYGSETNKKGKTHDYWLIKNSWGTEWGNYGYLKILRDMDT